MNRRRSIHLALAAAGVMALAACTTTSFGAGSSGFSVAQSGDYTLTPFRDRRFDKGYQVDFVNPAMPKAGTTPYNCVVGFKSAPQNNGLSRAEINKLQRSPERMNLIKATIGLGFHVKSARRVDIKGYTGHQLDIAPKAGPNHENVRGQMTLVETAKGRLTQICLTGRKSFAAAKPRFKALLAKAALPQ